MRDDYTEDRCEASLNYKGRYIRCDYSDTRFGCNHPAGMHANWSYQDGLIVFWCPDGTVREHINGRFI